MKKLFLVLLSMIVLFSCEKKEVLQPATEIVLTKEFVKTFVISDDTKQNTVEVKVSSDYESMLEGITSKDFTLKPLTEVPNSGNNEFLLPSNTEEGEREVEEDLNASNSIVVEYRLINSEEGIAAHQLTFDEPQDNNRSWQTYFRYYADGYIGGGVQKSNSSGYTKAKVGVLWQGSSWFYSWQVSDKLKDRYETIDWFTCGDFYKIAVKRNNKRGSSSVVFFSLDTCP